MCYGDVISLLPLQRSGHWSQEDLREDVIVSKISAVIMVTGQLTVPCDSLSNVYSQVHVSSFLVL